MQQEPFFILYGDLPRGGPGSDASTREAIQRLPQLPKQPRIVDMGCGPGRQTLVLAQQLGGRVTGVDVHEPFLSRLRRSADEAGLGAHVDTWRGSMLEFDACGETIDLVWSEGAAYMVGVPTALRRWCELLRSAGALAFTELVWLVDDPPPPVRKWLLAEYPAMCDIEGNRAIVSEAGLDLIDEFILPSSDWFDEYYEPMTTRIETLRASGADADADLAAELDEAEREIQFYQRYGNTYGYAFFIARCR